ncbi:MAG: hypothetical protein KME49_31165 [Brasilonema octagenarum HA4186-MV1]|jgi:hypothetical protein|nr:hypothetical protein [Brasilonema octagenarum HA4186-MV1]
MEYLTTHLEDAWRDLWQVFGTRESWTSEKAKCKDIQQRLSYFNSLHSDDPDSIDDVIQALSRGFYLIKSALEWYEPAVGHKSTDQLNDIHKARGIQWRLVMAYNGFEMITNTLLINEKYLTPETIKSFTNKCHLPDYSSLNPPVATRVNLEKWLNKPSLEKKSALADFLSVGNGDKTIIEEWIVKSTPVSTWVDAVRLTKAIRNATAHGALSPSKVNQWGLQKPLLTLSNNLGEIVVASILKLVYQQSYVH